MNILIISQYFWPENFKINDIAERLNKENFNLTVLTSYPSYPNKNHYSSFDTNKKKPEKFKEINIIRIPSIRRKVGYFNLSLNYISFIISSIFYCLYKLRKKNFDLLFVFQTSPATVLIPAVLLSKINKVPVMVWILDLWPETLKAMGIIKNLFLYNFLNYFFTYLYSRCDVILCQSKSIKNIINKKTNSKKGVFFPSWAEDVFYKNKKKNLKLNVFNKKIFKIIYSGNIGKAQDFSTIIEAAKELKENSIEIRWLFFGSGSFLKNLEKLVDIENLTNEIKFYGSYDLEYMPSLYKNADALIVSLSSNEISSITIPGKVQTYMTAGKPIIGILDGEAKTIIKNAKCGFVSKPGNSKDLARKIKRLYFKTKTYRNRLGLNAKAFSRKNYNKNNILNLLTDLVIRYEKK